MPRRPDMPCAQCGKLMWRGTGSRAAGQATCHPCRRVAAAARAEDAPKKRSNAPRPAVCVRCGRHYTARKFNQLYCTEQCRPPGHHTKASSTSRGYGYRHQQRRKQLLPHAYGHRCPLCYQVMLPTQALDLDHSTPIAFGGTEGDRIVHASCNRKHGNEVKRMLRRSQTMPTRTATRSW